MLDLHTHSTASDGTLTPCELVKLAKKIGLKAIALTDHDTTDGIAEAMETAKKIDQYLVSGVELSAEYLEGSFHIVGLFIDINCKAMNDGLRRVQEMRKRRNPMLAAKLAELGIPVTLEEATEAAKGQIVGRPHFAMVMIEKKIVTDMNEAFAKYLGKGGKAHVHKERLKPVECIELIREAGGDSIIAHPDQWKKSDSELDKFVENMRDLGIVGIETFCSSYKTHQINCYSRLAKKYKLLRSGGTDFHGSNKPKIKLGRGFGSFYVSDDLLPPLEKAAAKLKQA